MKNSNKFLGLIILILLTASFAVYASNHSPIYSETSPRYWVDINTFRINKSVTSIELYYSIAVNELEFEQVKEGHLALMTFSIDLLDTNKQNVYSTSKSSKIQLKSQEETKDSNKSIVDQIVFNAKPGQYFLRTSLIDSQANKISTKLIEISVPQFDNRLSLSSVQLASAISEPQGNGVFVFNKGGKSITPNPSRQYLYHNSILYIYYEIYNLVMPDTLDNTFLSEYSITDSNNDTIMVIPAKHTQKPDSSSAIIKAFDIRGLANGEYTLHVQVSDPASGETARTSNTFWVHSAKPVVQTRTAHLPMSKKDIKKYRDQIKYIATREELKIYDTLSPEGKEIFLINFWRSKDQTPETPENEFMKNYFARIDYANKHFKGRTNGLNSDMGRVFIVYGKPDDIENHTFEIDTKPYVIWHYFTSGRKYFFIFVDRNNDGVFTLVHSNVEGEVKNENWMEEELR